MHTCLSRQAGGSPSRSREGKTEGLASSLQPRRCVLGWVGTLPCSCVSTSLRRTQLGLTHRPVPGHLPVKGANSQDASTSPSLTLCTRSPSHQHTAVLSGLSGLGDGSMPPPVVTSLGVEPLDTTWRGGRAPLARTVTHSPGGGAGPDSTAPTAPASHTLGSAGSQRGAGGGVLPRTSAFSPQPAAPPYPLEAPLYPLEAPGVVARGPWEIPWTPVPGGARFARSPSTPPRAVPGGAAPWSGEAGAVCCGSCDLSRSCVSQPPHPCRSCAGDPGSPVPLGCEPPTPGLSRPARHGQRPPSPLAAAPTRAPAAA